MTKLFKSKAIVAFFFAAGLPISIYAKPVPCKTTSFKYILKKQDQLMSLKVCHEDEYLVSESCYKTKCGLKTKLKGHKIKHKPTMSPHFNACHSVGGVPMIGELALDKGISKEITLCFDQKKVDFIDADYVYRLLKE